MLHTNLFKTSFAFLSLSLSLGLLSVETFAQQCTPAPAGLVSWWAADGNALDSRSRHNGTLQNGANFAAGNAGQGFSFDGADDFVAFPTANFQSIRTMEFWLKTTISNQSIIDGGPSFTTWRIEIEPNGKILYRHFRNGTAGYASLTGITTVTDGQFYHIVTQSNSLAKTLKIFINGVLDASYTETDSSFTSWAGAAIGDIKLGKSDTQGLPGPLFFNGIVDEFGSYDRILTTSEILAVFNAGAAGKCKPTATVAPANLVVWLAGDGTPNANAGPNSGTLENGAGFAAGKVGQGFNFDGIDDFVNVVDSPVLDTSTAITIEAWVNTPTPTPAFAKNLVGRPGNYQLVQLTNGRVRFSIVIGATFIAVDSTTALTANIPAYLAGTYHAATGQLRIYVNGVLEATTITSGNLDPSVQPLQIGGFSVNFQNCFSGQIDEASLYNRALTQDEITSIFNAGIAGKLKTTATATGGNVSTNVGSDATLIFSNVSAAGTTQQIPLATAVLPALPAGFTHTGLAYDITTAASVSGNINLSFHLPSFTTQSQFGFLKVLHLEGGVFVDRTGIQDFASRTLTAQVSSLSPFVIADGSTPTAADGTITGRILADNGNPVEGAVVRMSGTQSRLTITDAQGNYRFDNVETNGFYTVTPARVNYSFNPAQRSFSQLGNQTEAGFSATLSADQQNPLETTEYFVRQQYVDFLGREPDEGGLNYWSEQINHCANDVACNSRKRIDVSAAFFMSAEFQESASYVYDMYAATLGRTLNFSEFTTDRSQVVGGLGLDAAKTAFAQNFVERREFTARYPQGMTREQFVDALLETMSTRSGVDHSSLRNQLLIDFDTSGRALVVRQASEASVFVAAEYNKAFVLIEYFGYLRRDLDQDGYGFWLGVLNNGAPNNYRGMVCAFLTSAEYQRRFSTVVTRSNASCSGAQ